MRKGFTLVELSIVLVIIGLLIGGILVAQSMIHTTKLQGVIRQLSQYDIAVSDFRTKFNQWPGDSTLFPNPGDGDGLIGDDVNNLERGNFWPHLSLGVGLKNSLGTDYIYTWPTLVGADNTMPTFNIEQDTHERGNLFVYGQWLGNKNYYWYSHAGNGNIYFWGPNYDPLRGIDSYYIDSKIDDGMPGTGNLQANSWGSSTTSSDCLSGGQYNMTSKNYACSLFIMIGIGAGQPQ